MQKYRVLKPYPKQITNSGRLVTLNKGSMVYLKKEAQVLRLIQLGFISPVVEMPTRPSKPAEPKKEHHEEQPPQELENRRRNRSEYLNKK